MTTIPVVDTSSPAAEWIERITDHIVQNGLQDASLRRLAQVAGTSHRMLSYYFGSRDGVLGAVMHGLRQRESERLIWSARSRRDALERAWSYYAAPERDLETRLFYYLAGLAAHDPGGHRAFLDSIVATWTDGLTRLGVKEGVPEDEAAVQARLLTAAMRGLALDGLLTGERAQVRAAFDCLLDSVLGA